MSNLLKQLTVFSAAGALWWNKSKSVFDWLDESLRDAPTWYVLDSLSGKREFDVDFFKSIYTPEELYMHSSILNILYCTSAEWVWLVLLSVFVSVFR